MKPAWELTATEAAAEIAARRLTSEQLVAACLERIAEREPAVGAWIHLDPQAALAEARQRDRTPALGALHGVPVGVKDIIDTGDQPTAYGAAAYEGHRPTADAACVALARQAGGVILGKTVSTEFAYFTPGKTANPHNPAHTPGGSSSGSAAAVGDCMVPLAFGTQTSGSVIRPASFCGAVGYKASFDGLPTVGVKVLAQTLDTLGVFARSVEDLARMRAALVGAPSQPAPRSASPRLGLCRTAQWSAAAKETQKAVEDAAGALGAEEVELPPEFESLLEAHQTILAFETARAFAWEAQHRADRISARFLALLDEGRAVPFERYISAQKHTAACRRALADIFTRFEALIAPAAPGEAPKGLAATGDPLFNKMWTLLGAPCVTLPTAKGPNGLPVGVQFVGALREDDALLSLCAWAEARLA
jgi:amidase